MVDARFDFRGRTLQGVDGAAAALEARAQQPRRQRSASCSASSTSTSTSRRRPRPAWTSWSRTCGPPSAKASTASSGWARRPRRRRTPSWPRSARRSAIRRKWRDYSTSRHQPRRSASATCMRALDGRLPSIELGKVGKPVDPEEWGMTPQTVNAYYNPVRNEIVFPAAILQPPFFDMAADDAVNYGGIGGGHRPRDGPRLRRPGAPLRRQGQAARLVDARRTARSSCAGPRAWSRSTRRSRRCPG